MNATNIARFLALVIALASGCVTNDESAAQCNAMASTIVDKAAECGFADVERPRCALGKPLPPGEFDKCMERTASISCGGIADRAALYAVTQQCMTGNFMSWWDAT